MRDRRNGGVLLLRVPNVALRQPKAAEKLGLRVTILLYFELEVISAGSNKAPFARAAQVDPRGEGFHAAAGALGGVGNNGFFRRWEGRLGF
jgi:hypothetical protein